MPISYKQTSPLGVPMYAFGQAPARINLAGVQFAHSASFFPIPTKSRDGTKIYQSVKPDFNPNVEYMKDPLSRDIPSVDSSLFILARKLILESK